MVSAYQLLIILVLIYVYWYYYYYKPSQGFAESRSLFGNVQPICVPCSELLPTTRSRNVCPSDPSMCTYGGKNSSGLPADLARIRATADQPIRPSDAPLLPTIFQNFQRSIESFCGITREQYIDAPNPLNLNNKDQLLSASAQGY